MKSSIKKLYENWKEKKQDATVETVILSVGEIIRNYRKRKGLSLENLAKQMDITKLSIQKYEVGKRTIPFNTLLDFFRILEIPLNELEKFFKKEEKSEIREILSALFKENKRK